MLCTGALTQVVLIVLVLVALSPLSGCSRNGRSGSPGGQASQRPASGKDAPHPPSGARNPVVAIETSMGTIRAELWADRAPGTAANFLRYAEEGFFDGLIFHRVIEGFMIQGGGFTPDMRQKPTHEAIPNEARADLRNNRGTLAMARTDEPHSATSQFFINLVDNDGLNHGDNSREHFGYCAFGKVTDGMDVVDRVGGVKTTTRAGHENVPVEPVIIRRVRRVR